MTGNSFENQSKVQARLFQEWKTHGNIIIAFDFDNTIYDWHKQGLDMFNVIKTLRRSNELGLTMFCFTANNDTELVRRTVNEVLGIENICINESPLDDMFNSRKPFYSILLDDRAGLAEATKTLQMLNSAISCV